MVPIKKLFEEGGSFGQISWYPPSPCADTGHVQRKCGTRQCLHKGVFAHDTYHRRHVADITQTYPSKHNMVPNSTAYTVAQESMELQLHPHFGTQVEHSYSLQKSTSHIFLSLYPQKPTIPKSAETSQPFSLRGRSVVPCGATVWIYPEGVIHRRHSFWHRGTAASASGASRVRTLDLTGP